MGRTIHVFGFPSTTSAEDIKKFFEKYVGVGKVYAVKVRLPKSEGTRAFAFVQFVLAKHCEHIISLASKGLSYGSSDLKVKMAKTDIVPQPRIPICEIKNVSLHMGCQISKDTLSAFWKGCSVSVEFEIQLRKLYFYISHDHAEYKLEISNENIWKIKLYRHRVQTPKFLVVQSAYEYRIGKLLTSSVFVFLHLCFQLYGAPRIYEKDVPLSLHDFDSPLLNYYKYTPDDQWVRTTDFTSSNIIGQSSTLCLELPSKCKLPNLRDHFLYCNEIQGHFIIESGSTFSFQNLVPIVGPPHGVQLPYKILFKINSLVQHGCLSGPTLDACFFQLVDPGRMDILLIEYALEKLHHLEECCYEPVRWLNEEYRKYFTAKRPKPPLCSLDVGLAYVRRVQITPCKVYFCGPEANVSNRVLRQYKQYLDNFLRVSFIDEDLEKMHSTDLSPHTPSGTGNKRTKIYDRILSILRNGIVIADKKFEFLAFSSSQLRENCTWMFASSPRLTAADIRAWMGDFREIRNVAKYAARLGQSFGSSTETLSVGRDELEIIDDIETDRGKYVSSDGIGKTSADFARDVAKKSADFRQIKNVAGYADRFGQSCGSSTEILSVGRDEVEIIDDIQTERGKYVFSDGIGKISADFAQEVAKKCNLKITPSAFQIRYGGYKGVVAVDPRSSFKLSLRDSMCKYESDLTKLDVLGWSKCQPCFLNRQLITLLSTLGVQDHVFEKKQKQAVDQLNAILTDALKAQEALDVMSGESFYILKKMLSCGYKPDEEAYLSMMLQTFRASKLLELRTKTRIFVPRARQMMGCLDETGTLEYGQVFVQISGIGRKQHFKYSRISGGSRNQRPFVLKTKVVVAKNPCLHPGDVRVLQAVNVPALHHMVDCVVFPQKGKRPHPSECSGSDLDGDIYFVCWDSELVPRQQIPPMDYTSAAEIHLDHDVTIEEVQEYFTNYIVSDSLGIISNAHTVFADRDPAKAMSTSCLQLAKVFSIAVDFPKTGVPAKIPPHLHVREYPDFMEKLDKPTYESPSVIGKLFREVKDITTTIKSFTYEEAKRAYDPDMEVDGFQYYISDAVYYKGEYDYQLGNLMDYYGIKTEGEILNGGIMKMSKSFSRRNDAEAISLAVRSLRKEVRSWFNEKGRDADWVANDVYAKASAWYRVTYHPDYWGTYNEGLNRPHFLSFPWCVCDKLMHIKRDKMSTRRSLELPSLNNMFSHGPRLE
ncbi:RNA-dependent RNA polymerase, eukaryotic-type [Dillenia turbinata]|uniref:RNA-dependent RNA polymerase n=1 Tax=Dillenia turbinata TaxID=194707 RepID=A0AAN8VH77_9MAGN